MNAYQFVTHHGLDKAKELIAEYPEKTHITNDGRMWIDESPFLEEIKNQLHGVLRISDIKQAIANMESCQ